MSEECLNLLEAYKPKRMEGGGLKSGESGNKRGLWLCPKENKPCSVWVLPLVWGGKPLACLSTLSSAFSKGSPNATKYHLSSALRELLVCHRNNPCSGRVPLHVSFGMQGVGLFAFEAWAWRKVRRQQRRTQQKFKVLGLDESCPALIVAYLLGLSLA